MEPDPAARPAMDDVVAYLQSGPRATARRRDGTQVLPRSCSAPPVAGNGGDPPTARTTDSDLRARSCRSAVVQAMRIALGSAAAVILIAVIGAILLLGAEDDPDDAAAALPNTTTDPRSRAPIPAAPTTRADELDRDAGTDGRPSSRRSRRRTSRRLPTTRTPASRC